MSDATRFAGALFDRAPAGLWTLFWTLRDRRSHWVEIGNERTDQVVEKIADTENDVYVSVSTTAERGKPFSRISNNDSNGIFGLWADIDIADPDVHKKWNLPPDEDSARLLLDAAGVEPTLLVHSGHGLQAWWLFEEFWLFESPEDKLQAADLSQQWNTTLRVRAAEHNWTVDSTFDLARVMRLPGTTNYKGEEPVPVRLMEVTGKRYDRDSFDPFSVDDSVLAELGLTAARVYVVDELRLNPKAVPPFDKFRALHANDPMFAKTWARQRRDLADSSPSAYDLSLASQVAKVEWEDQEIADLLIAHRREHGDDLKLRVDYYKRTIAKARESHSRTQAEEHLDEMSHALAEARASGDDDDIKEQRRVVLDLISEQLALQVQRVVKYRSTPPSYRLITPTGAIELGGPDSLLNWSKFRENVVAWANVLIPRFKPAAWDRLMQHLIDAAEEQDVGIESTETGQVYSWLTEYLLARPPTDDVEQAIENEYPYEDEQGSICVFSTSLRRWLWTNRGDKISGREMGRMLRSYGCMPAQRNVTIEGRRSNRSLWVLPDEMVTER